MNEWQEKRWDALIRNIKIDDELLKKFRKHGLLDNKQAEEIQVCITTDMISPTYIFVRQLYVPIIMFGLDSLV